MWVPVNEATLDNGCLYVLPKQCDSLWADASHPAHQRCAANLSDEEGSGGGGAGPPVIELRFPIHAVRPLPVPAGSVLAWAGNTVHWGAACGEGHQPRQSVAFTFKAPLPKYESQEAANVVERGKEACEDVYLSRYERWGAQGSCALKHCLCLQTACCCT
jgi:ectoine hydroxylase-related dioxygenase (phytanoyl-CoA dioxygenase family)